MIDTLRISEELLKLGFPSDQAKGLARLQAEAIQEGAATRLDLKEMEARLDSRIADVSSDVRLLKWMTGTLGTIGIGFAISILLMLIKIKT